MARIAKGPGPLTLEEELELFCGPGRIPGTEDDVVSEFASDAERRAAWITHREKLPENSPPTAGPGRPIAMTRNRAERHFVLDLRSGMIRAADQPEPEDDEEEWTEIGEIDPLTGRSTVDLEKARGWRPLSEFWRWR
jgi:hypothetical protein